MTDQPTARRGSLCATRANQSSLLVWPAGAGQGAAHQRRAAALREKGGGTPGTDGTGAAKQGGQARSGREARPNGRDVSRPARVGRTAVGRPAGPGEKQNGPLAGCRQPAANKRTTSGKPRSAAEAVRDGPCGEACLSFEARPPPLQQGTRFLSWTVTPLGRRLTREVTDGRRSPCPRAGRSTTAHCTAVIAGSQRRSKGTPLGAGTVAPSHTATIFWLMNVTTASIAGGPTLDPVSALAAPDRPSDISPLPEPPPG
jgi:hypothetical protein